MESQHELLYETPHVHLVRRNGWTYATRPAVRGIVTIVAVTDERELVLVEQRRDAVDGVVVEMPAGLVGDEPGHEDESLETAARRELLEETGFECEQMIRLGRGTTSPGITDDTLTVFHARGLRRVGEGGGVDNERIDVRVVALGELDEWLRERERDGVLVDLKIHAGLRMAGITTR